MRPAQVLLLENTRFHKGDTKNDDEFARALAKASGAQVFVNDAFGVVHRCEVAGLAVLSRSSFFTTAAEGCVWL
jgi:phosphoglycerate kinase